MNHTRTSLAPGGRRGDVVVCALFALSVVGCSDGQLGQAALTTPCAVTDANCDDGGGGINAPIAAGARFDVVVKPALAGALSVPLRFRPVDDGVVTLDEGVLTAVAPGISAVLLMAEDNTVVDVVHVSVQKVERLTLHRSLNNDVVVDERPLPASVQVFPGEELTLKLSAWAGAQQLAGDTVDVWTSTNPDFRVIDQGFARERRVRAPDEGSADLTVALPTGLNTTVHLEVIR